ncbi:hypothetical protein PV721_21190 [Streptomyces sp. MB09-01]|uniref:hypothetical protein n=1 Tax=Streptomyces sp. MB09-01 TaxID=3028666 RepID=UPI0029B92569|nr:hypothetical protein [Streptomyces sp. MB09-01]MDX3536843.1 hypothetical protein [Streptomyces sp. MB09-01]
MVSTDQQSTDRQNLVLDEAGIEAPVVFEGQAETSSRLHPLERPKFGELLASAPSSRRPPGPTTLPSSPQPPLKLAGLVVTEATAVLWGS